MSLEEGIQEHLPTTADAGRHSTSHPFISSNNQIHNEHTGSGNIYNYNPTLNYFFNMIAPDAQDAIQIKIATALKNRHVPQAVYDAQLASGCMEGTRVKILEDIEGWIKDPEAQSIFWLVGGAGMGKTAISKSVCERAQKDANIILGGSFFCSRSAGSAAQRDVRSVIPTLAQLLARQSTPFSQALADQLARDPDAQYKQVATQVEQLLSIPLLSLKDSPVPVVFVIDAVDECGSQLTTEETAENADSHRIVSDMLEALVGFSRSDVRLPVKFFVTSRPETHIRDTPVSDATFSKKLKLHTVDKEQVTADIRLYVSTRLSSAEKLQKRFTVENVDRLVQICDGLFIVASTALRHVLDSPGGLDVAEARFKTLLNAARDSLATDPAAFLDRIYSAILTHSGGVDQLQSGELQSLLRLLGALLSARMTLSIAALAKLLDLSEDDVCTCLARIHAVVHVPDDVNEPSLRTLHASFGDYLFERAPAYIKIARPLGHQLLAQGCFRVMTTGLHFNVSQSRSSYDPNPQPRNDNITFALEYACLQWIYHVSSVPEEPDVDDTYRQIVSWARRIFTPPRLSRRDEDINIIFRPRLLFWLEVMSVLGQIQRAAAMLMLAAATVRSKELLRFIRDAIFFVTSSQEAIEHSAPHIYLSALPFAPRDSLVYKTFAPLCTGLISVELFGIEHHGGRLVMTLSGHEDAVNSVSYSSDGLLVASGSTDGTVRIWDMRTGAEAMAPLRGGDRPIWPVAFSPDGGSVVSGDDAGTVHIWRLLDGHATPQRLTGHTDAITSVAWSSDGSFIASASKDTTLRLWNAETCELYAELRGHKTRVNAVAFLPDSRTVVSSSNDMTIRSWNFATGEPVGELINVGGPFNIGDGKVYGTSFSPDGKTVAGGSKRGIRLWKTRTGKKIVTLRNRSGAIRGVQPSADGLYLVCGEDKHVRLWTLPRYTAKASSIVLDGHTDTVCTAAFSPDGLYVASASDDRTVRIWSTGGGKSAVQFPMWDCPPVQSVGISPDGTVIVSGSRATTIHVWDARSGEAKLPPLEGHSSSVRCVVVSPNGRLIASASDDCTVRLWNSRTGRMIGKPLGKHTDAVLAVAFSADGRWLASGSSDESVYVWDVATRTTTIEPLLCDGSVQALAFSSGEPLLATADYCGSIYLWEVETTRPVRGPLGANNDPLWSITFSPDRLHVASGGYDGVARVWNITTGQQVFFLSANADSISSVAYSPDGRFIGTGSADDNVRIWNAETGTLIVTLYGHSDSVTSVAFTPDSQSIVSGSWDRTIRTFTVPAASLPRLDSDGDPHITIFSSTNKDGWQVGTSGGLLLWVPAAYRSYLPEPPCTRWIKDRHICFRFGGGGWIRGENWTNCWRGSASDAGSRNS